MGQVGWSFGNQSRAAVRIGECPDIPGLVAAAVEAGIDEAIVFGKCQTGFSFHPTRVGVPHPRLKLDLLGALSRALAGRGLRVFAYLNFGLDGEAGRRHADWLQQPASGEVSVTPDHIAKICPFTPYVDRLILPLVREMQAGYPLGGFFFDTMSAFEVCYCPACRAQYRQDCGGDIPTDPGAAEWAGYGVFQARRAAALIERIAADIRSRDPDAVVLFNHIGGLVYPGPVPESIPRLSADPPAVPPWISMQANFMSSGARPVDIFIERFYRGWGDRSGVSDATLVQKASAIFAYRCRFFVGDRLHPEGRLADGSRHAMRVLGALSRKMERLMPPAQVPRAPDAVILVSDRLVHGPGLTRFGRPGLKRLLPVMGAHQLMADCGWNFVLTPERNLARWLTPGRLLLLPEVLSLSPGEDQAIRRFLAAGGRLLAVGRVPRLADGSVPDWLGLASVDAAPWQEYVYLPAWKPRADSERPLVRGDVFRIVAGTACPLSFPSACYDFQYGTRMGAGANPPAEQPDSHPLLTCQAVGRGKAYTLNAPLCTDYTEGLPAQRTWFAELLRRAAPKPRARLALKSPGVEIAAYGTPAGRASWYVLLNQGGVRRSLAGGYPQALEPLPAFKAILVIEPRGRMLTALRLDGRPVPVAPRPGPVRIPLVMDRAWKVIKAQWC